VTPSCSRRQTMSLSRGSIRPPFKTAGHDSGLTPGADGDGCRPAIARGLPSRSSMARIIVVGSGWSSPDMSPLQQDDPSTQVKCKAASESGTSKTMTVSRPGRFVC
jgi:hypothetical protein